MERKELERRKLIRLITQGEAINVKNIFHDPTVRNGLVEIFGSSDGERAYQLLKDITKASAQKDWLIPQEGHEMMMGDMDPFGLTRVEYED